MNQIPEGIQRQVRATKRMGQLSRDIGDVALDVLHTWRPEERRTLAQRLRALADQVESVE